MPMTSQVNASTTHAHGANLGSGSPGAPLLDPQQLHESLSAVSSDLLEALDLLRDTYLEDAQDLVEQLGEAAESLDFDQIRFAAHTLKSSSALMGAMALSEVCREIEGKARTQNPDGLTTLVTQAAEAQRRVTEILLAYDPVKQAPSCP